MSIFKVLKHRESPTGAFGRIILEGSGVTLRKTNTPHLYDKDYTIDKLERDLASYHGPRNIEGVLKNSPEYEMITVTLIEV